MRCNSTGTITRTSTIKDPKTHIATNQTITLPSFRCRLGKASGSFVLAQPQGVYNRQLRIYIPNIKTDIKTGDIVTIDTIKYVVGNIYCPTNHHLEVDVTVKEEP